jgi:hypothetical protein
MSHLRFTASIRDTEFTETDKGGKDFVLTLRTPVMGPGDYQSFSDLALAASTSRFNISLQRRGEHDDETVIGSVSSFDMGTGRFTFLVPIDRAGETGFPMGAFVVTGQGIVGAVVSAKAEVGEIARRLIEVGALLPERSQAEQPAIEYTAVMIGGMTTTMTGMAYYYRKPSYHPMPLDSVRAGVQGPFFFIDERNLQSAQLIFRLAYLLADPRLDAYIAAAILRNASRAAKHDPDDYAQSVLQQMEDLGRVNQVEDAMESFADVRKER